MEGPLDRIDHRPWPLPQRTWTYYQEWLQAAFLHYRVDPAALRSFIPAGLEIDQCDGSAWVSLVAFDMAHVRPRWAPALSFVSNFHEVNLRTYVRLGDRAGVHFLRIDASKRLSVLLARTLSILPYRTATIQRKTLADGTRTFNTRSDRGPWELGYRIGSPIEQPAELDRWLTERYCLYHPLGGTLQRYEVHHVPWPLQRLELVQAPVLPPLQGLPLNAPDRMHFSPGVKVITWGREVLPTT